MTQYNIIFTPRKRTYMKYNNKKLFTLLLVAVMAVI